MKALKIIGIAILTFVVSGNATAQKEVSTDVSGVSTTKVDKEYFTDVKTLASYFKDNKIPASFPKYDNVLGEKGNAKRAAKWAEIPTNYALLSADGIKTLKGYKTKQSKEKNLTPQK